MSKKKILLWSFAALPLLALLLYVLFTALGGGKATIMEVSGAVAVIRGGKSMPATTSIRLKAKDAVSVGQNGVIWFRLDKNKTVFLDNNSTMNIIRLKKKMALDFQSGAALIRVDKALKKNESFQIQAGNATIGVRDACVFSIHSGASGNVTLNVYQGEVIVYGPDESELITLGKGLSIQIDPTTGALAGEVEPIDFSMLSKLMLDNVMDYAKEAGYIKSGDPPKSASSPEAESETPEVAEPEESEPEAEITVTGAEQLLPEQEKSAPAAQDEPDLPTVALKYMWDGKAFKPYADIVWADSRAAYIEWQLCDSNGGGLEAGGRFDASAGGIDLKNRGFDVAPPDGGSLYPMGYAIWLTPYYTPAPGEDAMPMPSVTMELPYFKVAAERSGTQITPVISTNIGFYFEHSYERLTDRVENNRIRITGSLIPLEGTKIPIQIDVVSG